MSVAAVATIEVAMADDGTYRLQVFRYRAEPSVVPDETVAGCESIPAGLRALAGELERRGRAEFAR